MLPQALAMLENPDQDTRVLGTVVLKHMAKKANPAATIPVLTAALDDEFFDVRMGAADALGALGDWGRAAIPALLSRTHDEEWWVRESVYMALTAMHNEQSRKALIDVMTAERHSVIWFQAHGKILKPVQEDPELHEPLALAYAQWLQKGDVWTAPFAARGKFNAGLGGLERYVKESIPIPQSVASVIGGILDGKVEPLWEVDERSRPRLEAILEAMNKSAATR